VRCTATRYDPDVAQTLVITVKADPPDNIGIHLSISFLPKGKRKFKRLLFLFFLEKGIDP
jgi:hypothetical protein